MNIQDYGAIGEIVGGVAVIATLIYLSVQMRQANIATHRSMYAQAATSISEFWLSQERWEQLLRRMLRTAGGRKYRETRRDSFHGEFSKYIDGILANE